MELVFISVYNYGCMDMALNFLESLKRVNIKNHTSYVTDVESFELLKSKNYKAELIFENEVNKEKNDFATNEFNNLTYLRYSIINKLLEEQKYVWYLDIDTVVMGDLNEYFMNTILLSNDDIVFQNDVNMMCTGCMMFKPTPITIELTNFMYSQQNTNDNDQIVFSNILTTSTLPISISLLNINQFPNGLLYFSEPHPIDWVRNLQEEFKRSNEKVYFIHANWMVGVDTKISAFKKHNLWFI